MSTLFYLIFAAVFHGCIFTDLSANALNCTLQIIFRNQTWEQDYANQSSSAYFNKSLEITNSLKASLDKLVSVISVTNLSKSDSSVVATVVVGMTIFDKATVNAALKSLNAIISESSSYAPCGASTSTTPPMTTSTRSISTGTLQNVTTMPPTTSTSPTSFLHSTVNQAVINLNSTTPNRLSTNPSSYINNTSIYLNMTTMSSVATGSTNGPNATGIATNMTTNPSNVTNNKVTSPTIDFNSTTSTTVSINSSNIYSTNTMNNLNSTINTGNLTTSTNPSTNSSNIYSTNTMNNLNSTINTGNLTASTNPSTIPSNTSSTSTSNTFSSIKNTATVTTGKSDATNGTTTSAINVSTTTRLPNVSGTKSSQSSSVINSIRSTISIGTNTVKDLNGSTITTTTYSTTSKLLSTGLPIPLKNHTLHFKDEKWINQYSIPDNEARKQKVLDLTKKISNVLGLSTSLVFIYSLTEGSINAFIGIPANISETQLNNSVQSIAASIFIPTTSTSSTILTTLTTTTQAPTLPTYAIILISIFSTALFIVILFVITALICRHRRLKGYGRHQVQFFEMENGWKYGARNQSFHHE